MLTDVPVLDIRMMSDARWNEIANNQAKEHLKKYDFVASPEIIGLYFEIARETLAPVDEVMEMLAADLEVPA